MAFNRITCDPQILGGKPCIKGTRISIEMILEFMASGASINDIIQAHPHLKVKDIEESLRYASHFLENEVILSAESKK